MSTPVSRPDAGSSTTTPRDAKRVDVRARGGVLPHLGVHGRGHHHRTSGREQRVREEVVGEAVRGLGQQVGRGGRDDDEVGVLSEPDVRHLVDVLEDVGAHGSTRQRLPRGRADELQRGLRGDDRDVVAGLGEQAHQ